MTTTTKSPLRSDATTSVRVEADQLDKFIVLHDGLAVSEDLFVSAQQHVTERLRQLERNKSYTARTLCGEEFWGPLTDGTKRRLGRCIADMVIRNLVPLSFEKRKHEYPYWYRIR